ncbi:uncharacterized protein F5891DRAFT_1175175 [Suillus fuscotomentosus]|uniref:Uncharacterized protein n=1 Tax=Suillus fuscotomentosus TaxID=1912939 RepID=A0AAD4E190_9AGAM|nr:uncharacterized protein F5891DRAFT_1175175 [Suillus fuscotomentosus]KAG1896614.1 hypothetical protein F5891DRAFT_1175175 [Suillus fuscotomentosus]
MRLLLICLFLCLVGSGAIQAAPTTLPVDTADSDISISDHFRLTPSLTTRTLWTIVSSSVLTIFACTYSAIHPNIPSPKDSYTGIQMRRLGIIIMALIAPELMVTWAMRQLFSANQVTKQFEKSKYPNVPLDWKSQENVSAPKNDFLRFLRFLRFLLMPFFFLWPLFRPFHLLAKGVLSVLACLCCCVCSPMRRVAKRFNSEQSEPEQSESESEDHTWTQAHSFFVLMGGFMLYVDGKPYLTLQPDHILKLIQKGCIDVPTLTADQIHDKSKGTAISKGLVMLQVAWFIMQLVTRVIYPLEITQLEVGTLAFAVLNFLTYAAWWNKPLDVECPHPVYWKSTNSRPEDHIDLSDRDQPDSLGIFSSVLGAIMELIGWADIPTSRKLRVPTFDGSIKLGRTSDKMILVAAGFLMTTIFGAIHCMALFLPFPTYEEHLLWSLLFLCASKEVQVSLCSLYAMFYIIARAVLFALMFTTLRNLGHNAYEAVSWTTEVPHL